MTRRRRELLGVALILALGLALGAPVLWLDRVVTQARRCFAAVETIGYRDCREEGTGLDALASLPVVGHHAARLREELDYRSAVVAYVDAAVGTPSRDVLRERLEAIEAPRRRILDGTGRAVVTELGRPLGVLGLAEHAARVGDAAGLLRHAETFAHHATTRRALEAAILAGDDTELRRLVRAHRERPDEELRLVVAALDCLLGDPEVGLREAVVVQDRRAGERKANFARDFGDARVIVEACADRVGRPPPSLPSYGHAGDWTHREQLMVMRLGLALAACAGACDDDVAVRAHRGHIVETLKERRPTPYRLELLASVLPSLDEAALVEALAAPLPSEPPPAARRATDAADWVDMPLDAPILSRAVWRAASEWVARLAAEKPSAALDELHRVLAWRGAMAAALEGQPDPDLVARGAGEDVALRGLGLALSALTTGDRAEAVHALARLTPTSSPLSVELALPEATRASALLAGTSGPATGWWTLLLAPGAPGTSEPLDRLVVAGPPHLPQSAEARAATMQALLSMWRGWLSSSEPRAVRYTLFHAPGDMPAEVVPWLLAVGRLLRDDPGGPDPGPEIGTEIWLDAATAIDGPKLGLRFRAQTRLRAAAARGDQASAMAWREVVGRLARRGQRPGEAELWRLVGL